MVAVRKINSYSLHWTPETEYAFLIDYLMRKEEQIAIKQNQVSGMTIGMINSADVFDFKSMHTHLRGVRRRIKDLQNKHGFTPSTYCNTSILWTNTVMRLSNVPNTEKHYRRKHMRVRIYQKHTHQNQQPLLFSNVTGLSINDGVLEFEHDAHINKERKVRANSSFILSNICGYSLLKEESNEVINTIL